MSRPYRLQEKNSLYHITSRGDDRKKIYLSDSDYKKFLEYILKAKDKYQFYLYAYVLMPNHYHLLIETRQPNLSRIMQYINTSYTVYYNIKRKRCGHLFQGRYKSIIVDKDSYLLELTRYIHLNPFRAKRRQSHEEYKWSSYKEYINRKRKGYIDKEEINKYINISRKQYEKFILDGKGKEKDIFKNVYAGCMLGKAEFIENRLKDLKGQVEKKDVIYKKELKSCMDKEEVIKIVESRYGKGIKELCKRKTPSIVERKITIYLMKRFLSLTNKEIGKIFGISYSAVCKVAKDVERLMGESIKFNKEIEKLISHFKV